MLSVRFAGLARDHHYSELKERFFRAVNEKLLNILEQAEVHWMAV